MFHLIQSDLDPQIRSGELIIVPDTGPFFDVLAERFPIGLNRISWEELNKKKHIDVIARPREITSDELRSLLSAHRALIRHWLDSEAIAQNTEVMWIGDDTEVGLKMTRETLLDLFPVLFSFPQHSYALPADGAWCLNYIMEGELFFAAAGCPA